jgi:hypothetical protein
MGFNSTSSDNNQFSQCFSVGANVSYRFGLVYTGAPICVLNFYSVGGCDSSYQIGSFVDGVRLPDGTNPNWDSATKPGTTPAGTVSAKVVCVPNGMGGSASFDQIYFNTGSTGTF